MSNIQTFAVGEVFIRQHNGLFSLNDLHKAAGGAAKHQPALFMRLEQTQALSAEIASSTDSQGLAFQTVVGKGKAQGTYACRELVIAYAAWISPAFHLKVIRVFLDAAAQPHTITAAQQQHLKELVALVAESGRQTHGETWARLHRKFGVPRYVELPAARFEEACQYLKGKLDAPSIAALVQKHLPQAVPAPTLQGRRWLVSVDRSGRETAMPVPEEAVLLAVDEIAAWLGEPGVLLHSGQLAAIACACIQRMAQRLPAAPGSRAAAPAFPSLV